MKRIIPIILLIVSFQYSYADEENHRFPMDLHDLGLTPQQHKGVEAAMKEYQSAYRRHHDQSEMRQKELNRLFLAPVFDGKAFKAKSLEMQRPSAEIQTRLFERLHRILTSEQRRRFIRHIREWEGE